MPNRIILSRKGFDRSAGGWASPIIDNKILLSFPIPYNNDYKPNLPIPYSKLTYNNKSYETILSELTKNNFNKTNCHLDPDIYHKVYEPRNKGWKPIFGPEKGKYTHLKEHGVNIGDLILFFGWFKHAKINADKNLEYINDSIYPTGMHIIFGFMEIGQDLLTDNKLKIPSWAHYHPHVSESGRENEHIFIASKSGVFDFSERLILTKDGQSRSKWKLPFLKDIDMSCNPNREVRWNEKEQYFRTVGRGQEFVLDAKPRVMKWVNSLF